MKNLTLGLKPENIYKEIAIEQKAEKIVSIADVYNEFSFPSAFEAGANILNLLYATPNLRPNKGKFTMVEAIDMATNLIKSGAIDVVYINFDVKLEADFENETVKVSTLVDNESVGINDLEQFLKDNLL